MAIAFGEAGAAAVGTTPLTVPYPANITAGQLLVLFVGNKYPTNGPSTPTDWTAPSGNQYSRGGGTPGADTGDVYITVYVKIATGSETGNLTVTVTGANTSIARMFRVTKDAAKNWEWVCAGGSDNTAGTSWSVTAGSDPGVTAGDMIFIGSCICGNTDTGSGYILTQTGVTFGTVQERQDSGSNTGDDVSLWITEHPVNSGTGSAAPVYTATVAGTGSANAAGASLVLRLREITPPITINCTAGALVMAGQPATVSPGGGVTINATAGALAMAGQVADVQPGPVTVQATAGPLVIAGQLADVQPGPVTVQATVGPLVIAGQQASVSTISGPTINCTPGAMTLAGQLADVEPGAVTVQSSAGALTLTGQLADVQPGGVTIQAIPGALVLTGQQADVIVPEPVVINCTVGALVLTGLSAQVYLPAEEGESSGTTTHGGSYRRHFLQRLKDDDPWRFFRPEDEPDEEEEEAEEDLPLVKGVKLVPVPAPERPAVTLTVWLDAVGLTVHADPAAQSEVEIYRALPVHAEAIGAWSEEDIYDRAESGVEPLSVHAREEVLA